MDSIIIRNLVYKYNSILSDFVLGPVDLEIGKGQLIFFSGNNGSGKTTLAKILTGKIGLSNEQQSTIKSDIKSTFYYNQLIEENIFPELTVYEHINLFSKRSLYNISQLFELFPVFQTLQNKYPDQLSGGQNQLLGFCTIICKHFDLIVFDEVLNHLDSNVSLKVLDIITKELIGIRKATVIIIAHNFGLLTPYSDTIIHFESGKTKITNRMETKIM